MNNSKSPLKLRIAIAGLGFGKNIHLEALKDSDYLIPTAIYHYKKEKIKNNLHLLICLNKFF